MSDSEAGPAAKKAKRSCKWQPSWKCYNVAASKKGPRTFTVVFVALIFLLLVEVCMM